MDWTYFGFIIYLILILAIGFFTYSSNNSHKDFFLADRKLNPWLVAFSERTAGESAWLILGLPGAALAVGFVEIWTALGCVFGIIIYWYFIAKDIRIQSEDSDAITLPHFLSQKFYGNTSSIRIISTIVIIFFFTIYLAAQFNGAGKALETTFGIPNDTGIFIGASVIILYTMMGGFLAVVWTDLVQGIIMIGTLILLPIIAYIFLLSNNISVTNAFASVGENFTSLSQGKTGWSAFAVIISGLSWGFGYFGQPHLVTKFMAIKDPQQIKTGRRIAFLWAIPAFTGAFLIGIFGLAMYGQGHFTDVEKVMPQMANDLLPPWLAGIFISGAIAAMMSTADSLLLVLVSTVIEDFYHKTLGKKISEKSLLNLSRIITLIIGIIAFIIAITSKTLIFQLVSYAWSGLGASFGPALILVLKWKKVTKEGVIAGILTGAVSTIIWQNISFLNEAISVRFVSFALSFLVIWIVSLSINKKSNIR
ncbi:sodium/proline symporter [Bacteroidetes/Chlorobi group bacterium ChocPot_Mid]|nr:MAG: sodium/proline symporter [Bacteroidetes/Chlorobi group bacterium ChocPot_Mid]